MLICIINTNLIDKSWPWRGCRFNETDGPDGWNLDPGRKLAMSPLASFWLDDSINLTFLRRFELGSRKKQRDKTLIIP